IRLTGPDAFEKADDRRRTAGERAQGLAALVFHRLWAAEAAGSQVRHQAEKERQGAFWDPFFVQRQGGKARRRVPTGSGIFDALGDALVGQQFTKFVILQKFCKLIGGDVGVNRHVARPPSFKVIPPRQAAANAATGRTRFLPPPRPSPHADRTARRTRP